VGVAVVTRTCAHCGQQCGDYDGGYGAAGDTILLCHPNDPSRPDCYRRVTVYHENIGTLVGVDPKPAGVLGIHESGPLHVPAEVSFITALHWTGDRYEAEGIAWEQDEVRRSIEALGEQLEGNGNAGPA
jgi:hypothetical protein